MNVKRDNNKSLSKELLKTIAIVLGFALCTKLLLFDFLQLEGDSMLETLKGDEKVLINKAIYKTNEPRRGDVIVFNYPNNRYFQLIKRVIAIEGDTIEICGGKVVVNDIILEEKYIREKFIEDFEKKVVPKNCVFVMGDNRNNSKDSRFEEVGFVQHSFIKGKAIVVIWPIRRIRKII
ncbi:MAG: signal peptidase I [Alkaliphilus sp.]|nr:signal peptidase I [Alkaliphilus sp.]